MKPDLCLSNYYFIEAVWESTPVVWLHEHKYSASKIIVLLAHFLNFLCLHLFQNWMDDRFEI